MHTFQKAYLHHFHGELSWPRIRTSVEHSSLQDRTGMKRRGEGCFVSFKSQLVIILYNTQVWILQHLGLNRIPPLYLSIKRLRIPWCLSLTRSNMAQLEVSPEVRARKYHDRSVGLEGHREELHLMDNLAWTVNARVSIWVRAKVEN